MGTVINVGGMSRSGSTMLHLILGNDPDAFACGEAVNLFRPVKAHHRLRACACGHKRCPVWERLDGVVASSFYRDAFSKLGVEVLVDSSKEASWLVDARRWINRSDGMSGINIFSYKRPIDLAYSFWKRGRGLQSWRDQLVMYYRRISDAGLPLLTVNLDELLQDPQRKVEQVCLVLGVPYGPGRERFWERDRHHLYGNFGVRRQVQIGRSVFQPRRDYPDDFARHMRSLQASIEVDDQLQRLMQTLDAAEVSHASPGSATRQATTARRPYPPWYYRQRAKRVWFGRFPRSIDNDVRNSAATVPFDRGDTSA